MRGEAAEAMTSGAGGDGMNGNTAEAEVWLREAGKAAGTEELTWSLGEGDDILEAFTHLFVNTLGGSFFFQFITH